MTFFFPSSLLEKLTPSPQREQKPTTASQREQQRGCASFPAAAFCKTFPPRFFFLFTFRCFCCVSLVASFSFIATYSRCVSVFVFPFRSLLTSCVASARDSLRGPKHNRGRWKPGEASSLKTRGVRVETDEVSDHNNNFFSPFFLFSTFPSMLVMRIEELEST